MKIQEQIPCSYGYKLVSDVPGLQHTVKLGFGEDVALKFMREMRELAEKIMTEHIMNPTPRPRYDQLTQEEKHRHGTGNCHICEGAFKSGERRVLDHDHFKLVPGQNFGQYRGPAHNRCNLNYKISPKTWKLPVFFHNLRGFDSHLLIKAYEADLGDIKIIPTNMEKYLTFSIGQVRFLDSMQFMNSSLEKLVEGMNSDELYITQQEFPDPAHFACIKKKGVYPYSYFDSLGKFSAKQLPPKTAFKNDLTGKDITDADYQRARDVWRKFRCTSMRTYHDIYLKTDVTLLADVFEGFRTMCTQTYGLDPVHYVSAPSLAWDAALKLTKVNLELLTDPGMHLFFENAIRGGISMISKRHGKANHSLLPSGYDELSEAIHLIYVDCNNLYGHSMSECLPTGGFTWLDSDRFPLETCEEEVLKTCEDDIKRIPVDSPKGYTFNLDLHYPQHLHDDHSDYPLAPEKVKVESEMFSPFMVEQFPDAKATEKLVPNLSDKQEYTVHYRTLQLYLELGMRITKIHKVLEFDQSPWLKPYIDLNTCKRSQSNTEFQKNLFKLMNNAVYGKTMENVRRRMKVTIVTEESVLRKRVSKPTFKRAQKIRDDMVAMQNYTSTVHLNRPIYCGFVVLELSKQLMYDFHYNHMKARYPLDKLALVFTDTDSLCYEVKTNDIYEDMRQDARTKYDFSDYPRDHHLYDDCNRKKIGFFKDELNSIPLEEVVALRPKCYSLKYSGKVKDNTVVHRDLIEKKVAAGVVRTMKEEHLKHAQYLRTLQTRKRHFVTQNRITSKAHSLYTVNQTKVALCAVDTKRYILNDGIHTIAYGHYRIAEDSAEGMYTSNG